MYKMEGLQMLSRALVQSPREIIGFTGRLLLQMMYWDKECGILSRTQTVVLINTEVLIIIASTRDRLVAIILYVRLAGVMGQTDGRRERNH